MNLYQYIKRDCHLTLGSEFFGVCKEEMNEPQHTVLYMHWGHNIW